MTHFLARLVVMFIRARFVAHGCDVFTEDGLEAMAQVIVNDTCHARADFMCVAFALDLDHCGMQWYDRCTILKPGPNPKCD